MKFGEQTPFGRPGQPVEIAPIYMLLASQEGSCLWRHKGRWHRLTEVMGAGMDPAPPLRICCHV